MAWPGARSLPSHLLGVPPQTGLLAGGGGGATGRDGESPSTGVVAGFLNGDRAPAGGGAAATEAPSAKKRPMKATALSTGGAIRARGELLPALLSAAGVRRAALLRGSGEWIGELVALEPPLAGFKPGE
jgi:hypothetical protein